LSEEGGVPGEVQGKEKPQPWVKEKDPFRESRASPIRAGSSTERRRGGEREREGLAQWKDSMRKIPGTPKTGLYWR